MAGKKRAPARKVAVRVDGEQQWKPIRGPLHWAFEVSPAGQVRDAKTGALIPPQPADKLQVRLQDQLHDMEQLAADAWGDERFGILFGSGGGGTGTVQYVGAANPHSEQVNIDGFQQFITNVQPAQILTLPQDVCNYLVGMEPNWWVPAMGWAPPPAAAQTGYFAKVFSAYTVTNQNGIVAADPTSGGSFAITLTDATALVSQQVTFKHIGSAHTVTLTPIGGQTIDGASTLVLNAGEAATLYADGSTTWRVLSTPAASTLPASVVSASQAVTVDGPREEGVGAIDNPAISLGAANGNSVITGAGYFSSWTVLPGDSRIRVLGSRGPLVSIGGSYPFSLLCAGPVNQYPSIGASSPSLNWAIEFEFFGTRLEIAEYAQAGALTPSLWVNGVKQVHPANPGDGSMRNILLDWTNAPTPRATRRIKLTQVVMGGFYHAAVDGILAPSSALGPRLVYSGDSFTTLTNTVDYWSDLVRQAAALAGIRDAWGTSLVGTGYVQSNGSSPALTPTRLNADTLSIPNVNVVVIPTGFNDSGQTVSTVVTAAELAWATVLATGVQLVVVGPWACPASGGPPSYSVCAALDTALAAAAAAMGVTYISPIQEAWITGTGYAGAQNGSGTSDYLIASDGIHPSQMGHDYMARRLSAHLATLLSPALGPEAPRYVGAAGQPAFQNSCANWTAGQQPLFFYKDLSGLVHIEGVVTVPGAVAIFTLPVGYRPIGGTVGLSNEGYGAVYDDQLTVSTAGVVTSSAAAGPLFINTTFRPV